MVFHRIFRQHDPQMRTLSGFSGHCAREVTRQSFVATQSPAPVSMPAAGATAAANTHVLNRGPAGVRSPVDAL